MNDICFVFSGIGAQWPGMGAPLLAREAAFRRGVEIFDAAFAPLAGWSPKELLLDDKADLSAAEVGHPCIMAVEFGLWTFLESRSVAPLLILGHSGGEAAAAWAAGALSEHDAAFLAWRHSLLLKNGPRGRMLHLALPLERVEELVREGAGRLAAAAYNSKNSFVISGDDEALTELAAKAEATKGRARFLTVDVPFHSPLLAPFLDDFEASLKGLTPRRAKLPLISSLLGREVEGLELTASYWRRHVAEPVRFDLAFERAINLGCRRVLEVAPHAALLRDMNETARAASIELAAAPMMLRGDKGAETLEEALRLAGPAQAGPEAGKTELARTLAALDFPSRQKRLTEMVLAEAAALLEAGSGGGGASTPFMELGLNSLTLMRLKSRLAQLTGVELASAALFNHASPEALAAHLAASPLLGGAAPAKGPAPRASHSEREALAVVGVALRLPGGISTMEQYWDFLRQGRDAVGLIPNERWDRERYYHPDRERPGTMHAREAAFIDAPFTGFDAAFFNMAGREARQLDPQQRLLMEMSWEAFEQGGINPLSWQGRRAGVFLGLTNNEYSRAHRESYHRGLIDAYSLTGTTASGACGRISYYYGFEGPCFSVDTACSSGLVALSLACQSLRRGESDLALVGAVTLMLTPDLHICFTKLGAISPDGRCKTFDDKADGYGRGEGGAMLLLKRRRDAEREGDMILGLIRGAALNQDGKSNGLTAPNGLAQQKLVREALGDAGLSPHEVDYVEAHGTGTALGDSIELDSLAEAYCAGRDPAHPLRIGSVKANIGHLEPAAALASALKVLACFQHGAIPANIHLKTPNTRFPWANWAIEAPTALSPWPAGGRPRRAGVSAFGFSGVNGHAILEEFFTGTPQSVNQLNSIGSNQSIKQNFSNGAQHLEEIRPLFLTLSARDGQALRELAKSAAERLSRSTAEEARSLCRSLALNRPHFRERLFALADTPEALAGRLEEAARRAAAPAKPGPLGLMFTGQGSQYPGMGRELMEAYPAFAAEIERAAAILARHGVNLEHLLSPEIPSETLSRSSFAQPAICAVSLALWRLWESFGLRFDSVLGHSIGEYPAAVAAGFLSPETALTLVAERGRLMEQSPPGGMLAIFASLAELEKLLAAHPAVSLAGHNAPRSLTVSGPLLALSALEEDLRRANIAFQPLHVSRAFHSPAMNEASRVFRAFLEETLGAAGERRPEASAPLFISTVSGGPAPSGFPGPAYWAEQIVRPVLFEEGAAAMSARVSLALEAGPSAALSGLAGQGDTGLSALASLSPRRGALASLLAAVGELYVRGHNFEWEAVMAPLGGGRASLPLYPFQRETYWMPVVNEIESAASEADEEPPGRRGRSPLFGQAAVFETLYSEKGPLFVQEHVIFDQPVSPAAAHLAMILAAVKRLKGEAACDLLDAEFLSPLVVSAGRERLVEVIIENPKAPESGFLLASCPADAAEGEWLTHCRGRVRFAASPPPEHLEQEDDFRGRSMSPEDFYHIFTSRGYNLAEGFRRIREISMDDEGCRAKVRSGPEPFSPAGEVIYPGALDAILQTIMPSILEASVERMHSDASLFIPLHLARLSFWGPVPESVRCRAAGRLLPEGGAIEGRVAAYDESGRPVLSMEGLFFRLTDYDTLYRQLRPADEELGYEEKWLEAEAPEEAEAGRPLRVVRLDEAEPEESPAEEGGDLLLAFPGTGEEPDPAEADRLAVTRAVGHIKAWLKSGAAGRLYLVTRGTRLAPGDVRVILAGSGLWGLGQSFALEHPDNWGGLMDLESGFEGDFSKLVRGRGKAFQEARRNGRRLALRLEPCKIEAGEAAPDYGGTHIISGGTGALGLALAEHLAGRGAEALILISRRGPDEAARAKMEELRARGLTVLGLALNVADRAALNEALKALRPELPPLAGVFHLAGLLADGVTADLDEEKIRRVMSVKAAGAWALHQATLGDPLKHFVLYSSAAALIGSPGQANYAAANHFLNALARSRRLSGLPGTALAWGPWGGGGMASADSRREEHLARQGLFPLEPEECLAALDRAVMGDVPVLGFMRADWRTFLAARGEDREGIFRKLAPPPRPEAPVEGAAPAGADASLAAAVSGGDSEALLAPLQAIVADLLGFKDPERIEPDTPLTEFGLDSLMVVQLRNRVRKVLDRAVPVSLAFEYPTVRAIAGWIKGGARTDEKAGSNADEVLSDIERLLNE